MIQDAQVCQILGHNDFCPTHICTHKNCVLEYKLLCQLCIKRKSHNHQQKSRDHIIEIGKSNSLNHNINKQELSFKSLPNHQKQEYNTDQLDEDRSTFKLSLYFEFTQAQNIRVIQISQTGDLIAICGENENIKIIDMVKRQEQNIIKQKHRFMVCAFSRNSKILLLGDIKGNIYSYNMLNKKIIQLKKKKPEQIHNLLSIFNKLVIYSTRSQICILDMRSQKIIATFRNQESFGLDLHTIIYDYKNDSIIIFSMTGRNITIIKRINGSTIIKQEIQFTTFLERIYLQTNNILYICGKQEIIKCQIDYFNKNINIICKLQDFNAEKATLYNFIPSINLIAVVSENKVLVLDSNLQIVKTFLHNIRLDLSYMFLKLLDFQKLQCLLIPSISIKYHIYKRSFQPLQNRLNLNNNPNIPNTIILIQNYLLDLIL